jgi:hypothetical protein
MVVSEKYLHALHVHLVCIFETHLNPFPSISYLDINNEKKKYQSGGAVTRNVMVHSSCCLVPASSTGFVNPRSTRDNEEGRQEHPLLHALVNLSVSVDGFISYKE